MHLIRLILLHVCSKLAHSTCIGQSATDGTLDCGVTATTNAKQIRCIELLHGSGTPESFNWEFGKDTVISPKTNGECLTSYTEPDRSCLPRYNISKVGIETQDVGTPHQLYITSNIYIHNRCQFSLNFALQETESSQTFCKYYQIESKRQETRHFHANFKDRCFGQLQPAKLYDLNITNLQTNSTQTYRFFTSSQLFTDKEIANATGNDWQTLIAVTLHSNVIVIYLQGLPTRKPKSYLIELVYVKFDNVQLESSIIRRLTTDIHFVEFESRGDLLYTIQLLECNPIRAEDVVSTDKCRLVQKHSFQASDIHTANRGENSPASEMDSVTPTDVQVIRETESGVFQKQDLYILLGTIFGVVFFALIIVIVLFIYFKRRQAAHRGLTTRFSGGHVYTDELMLEEDLKGAQPTILLLYSYDCQQHLVCVQSFALLLQNAFGCSVMADFWATQEIAERGIYQWLEHKLATVNYIMMVCSTGARFKSVTNRRVLLEQNMDDAFITALRLLQSRTDCSENQKLVVYFDYSCESDIPVFVESWQRYKLMKDIKLLIPSVADVCMKDTSNAHKDEHEQIYIKTLQEKIDAAKKYMLDNPNWFHANLQSDRTDLTPQQSRNISPSFPRSSQPLPLVTVEHNRSRRDSTDGSGSGESRYIDTISTQKPDCRRAHRGMPCSPPLSPALPRAPGSIISGVDSYSSSVEDLEHDIDFILHPNLPSKSRHAKSQLPTMHPLAIPATAHASAQVLGGLLSALPHNGVDSGSAKHSLRKEPSLSCSQSLANGECGMA